MTVFLYIRLSSADKDLKFKTESESISNQRKLLHKYIDAHPDLAGSVTEEFVDDGYSGTNADRPSFERMIERVKNGEADTIICKDFSRFFRDYVEIGDYLERIFPFLGVRFISVNDGYDSNDYKGTTAGMEVVMKYIVYASYSRDLSQKIKTVMQAKHKKGQWVGAYAPYGYSKDAENKNHLVPNPDTAPIVRRIFDLAINGKKTSEIAVILNKQKILTPAGYFRSIYPDNRKFANTSEQACWNTVNVKRILRTKLYTGAMVSNTKKWKSIDDNRTLQNDEIITRDEFLVIKSKLTADEEKLGKEMKMYQNELNIIIAQKNDSTARLAEKAEDFLSRGIFTNDMLLYFIDKVKVYSGGRIEIVYRFQDVFESVPVIK